MKLWLKGLSKRKNTMACFRYTIKKTNASVLLKMAAAGSFRLTVNGDFIGYGPARVWMGHSAIREYDISQYTKEKDAIIVAEVVYHGTDSFYIVDEQPFFWCEIYENGRKIATAKDFSSYLNTAKQQKVIRYSCQRNFLEAYVYEKNPRENYFGKERQWIAFPVEAVESNRLIEADLPYPTFKEEYFEQIEEGGVEERADKTPFNCGKSSALDRLTVMFPQEELESDAVAELSKYYLDVKSNSKNRFVTYQLKGNKTGFIKTKLRVDGDCELFYVFDEICNDEKVLHHSVPKDEARWIFDEVYRNGTLRIHIARMSTRNIVKYTLKAGEYDLCTYEPYTMKFLRIIAVGARIEVKQASLVLYENDRMYDYCYQSNDEKRELVFKAAQSTLAQNAVDILTDCPSRERAGWLCDCYFSARAEHLLTGQNQIEKNLLNCYLNASPRADLPTAMPPMVYPDNHYSGKFIPNWAMWLYIELDDYLARTGDRAMIDAYKEKAMALYEYFCGFENEYGLLENLKSWVFVEWSKSNDYTNGVNFPTNMLYVGYLSALYRMYGDDRLKEKAEKIKAEINRLSFNGEFYEDHALREDGVLTLKGHITETCQYYAFYFGVATKESRPTLYQTLFYDFLDEEKRNGLYGYVAPSNMFIGDVLRLDYLHKNGENKKAVEECIDLFGRMAEKTGTLWEFEGAVASCCHAFASVCVCWLVAEQNQAKEQVCEK